MSVDDQLQLRLKYGIGGGECGATKSPDSVGSDSIATLGLGAEGERGSKGAEGGRGSKGADGKYGDATLDGAEANSFFSSFKDT